MKPVVLPELRFRRVWFGIGVAMAIAVTIAFLAPGGRLPDLRTSDKLLHALAFTVLAFWFGSILVRRDLGWMLLALVLFGVFIEVAQATMQVGRHAEFRDVVADAVGALAGMLLALTPLGRWPRWVESCLPGRAV